MVAKRTSKNQITLPKAVVTRFGECEYFDVTTDGDRITLRPLQRSRSDDVRAKLDELGNRRAGCSRRNHLGAQRRVSSRSV